MELTHKKRSLRQSSRKTSEPGIRSSVSSNGVPRQKLKSKTKPDGRKTFPVVVFDLPPLEVAEERTICGEAFREDV